MNWYFALSETTIDREGHDWRNMIRVAVQSAKDNTSLVPHLLYDGGPNEFVDEIRTAGVRVIHHRVAFYEALRKHGGNDALYVGVASGAFLRFEIPLLEKEENFVLYTDCDVIFRRDPDFFQSNRPDFFAATSQTSIKPAEDMNSGVMLINVKNMRSAYDDLVAFTCAHLHVGFDQEILRIYFDGKYAPADLSINWKPYWGVNPEAQIVHFHGPKPCMGHTFTQASAGWSNRSWQELHARSVDGYTQYGELWLASLDRYKKSTGKSVL